MTRLRASSVLGTWCLAAAGVVASRPGLAAPLAELDSALDYEADSACPGRDRFVALVDRAIEPGESSSSPTATGMRLRVAIRATPGGYRGSLEKRDPSGSSEPRVVASPICAEVAQALALTTAFSLAPESRPAVALRPAAVLTERHAPAPPPPTGQPAAAGWWLVAVGASGGGTLSTGILTGIEGSGGRTFPVGAAALPFTVSVRLRTTYARNDWTDNSPIARFTLWTAALETCGLTRPFGVGVEVGLCASGESGWLRGRGVRIANPRTTDSLWLAFGGGPLVRVAIGPRWHVEARGAAVRPLRRAHFSFESPDEPVAETPTATWTAALAIGARFP